MNSPHRGKVALPRRQWEQRPPMTTTRGERSSSTTSTSTGSSDDQWLRDFRVAKQSILTTPSDFTSSAPSQRRMAELDSAALSVGELQHEIKSIVDMLQLERAVGTADDQGADKPSPKTAGGQASVMMACAPAASPLSSSSSSSGMSRASTPSSTSSLADDDGDDSSSSSSSGRISPLPGPPLLLSSPLPHQARHSDGMTASNAFSPRSVQLQWLPRQQQQQQQQRQQQQSASPPRLPAPMSSTHAAITTATAVHSSYLLTMVQEEKERSRQQVARIQELELALLETQQECELAIASARLESHELTCMLRRMASESTFADVFQVYEAHIARVEREVHVLRERNVHLEAGRQQQQFQQQRGPLGFSPSINVEGQGEKAGDDDDDNDNTPHPCSAPSTRRGHPSVGTTAAATARQSLTAGPGVYHHHGKGGGRERIGPRSASSKSERSSSSGVKREPAQGDAIMSAAAAATATASSLRGKIKDLQRQVGELKQETGELRRRERQFLVQKRMVETTWARVQKVQAMATGLEGSLASCRLDGARAEARLEEAEEEIRALRHREVALLLDRDRILLELGVVQRQRGGDGGNGAGLSLRAGQDGARTERGRLS